MMSNPDDPHRYDDIIDLPHHVSVVHPRMPLYDRAAQFAPFKALSGYEDEVNETARLTDERIELDEERMEQLDIRLRLLEASLPECPEVSVTFFAPDERKTGGSYQTVTGRVGKFDTIRRTLILRDGREIPIEDIYAIEGELFALFDE